MPAFLAGDGLSSVGDGSSFVGGGDVAQVVSFALAGINSTIAVGTLAINATQALAGIDSSITVGTPTVHPGPISAVLAGIDSTIAVGAITPVPGRATVALAGIDSTIVLGVGVGFSQTTGNQSRAVAGIDSTIRVGALSFTFGPVAFALTGIPPASAVGVPIITVSTVFSQIIDFALQGIDSTIKLGARPFFAMAAGLLDGIDSTIAVGVVVVQVAGMIFPPGIASTLAMGSITFVTGPTFFDLDGIDSTITFGTLTYFKVKIPRTRSGLDLETVLIQRLVFDGVLGGHVSSRLPRDFRKRFPYVTLRRAPGSTFADPATQRLEAVRLQLNAHAIDETSAFVAIDTLIGAIVALEGKPVGGLILTAVRVPQTPLPFPDPQTGEPGYMGFAVVSAHAA